jgi:hypothetical protein
VQDTGVPFCYTIKINLLQKSVPDQWLVSKTILVFKNKGEKKNVESYRPIANLCSASKISEKLIVNWMMEIHLVNNCNLTENNQHVLIQKSSSSTLTMELQPIISRDLDEDKYVLLSSLELSSASDIINIEFLIKRLSRCDYF